MQPPAGRGYPSVGDVAGAARVWRRLLRRRYRPGLPRPPGSRRRRRQLSRIEPCRAYPSRGPDVAVGRPIAALPPASAMPLSAGLRGLGGGEAETYFGHVRRGDEGAVSAR